MVTQVAFSALVVLVAVQRLAEVRRSRRNAERLLARGGREHARRQMPWMIGLHAGWLVAMVAEVLALQRAFAPWLAIAAGTVFAAGQGLRYAALRALGERWTARVVTVPGERVHRAGIYRWVRHPNYLGVALEIAALPLVHGAWLTAVVFSALNAALLARRIGAEEAALAGDSDYRIALAGRPRIVPRPPPRRAPP